MMGDRCGPFAVISVIRWFISAVADGGKLFSSTELVLVAGKADGTKKGFLAIFIIAIVGNYDN